MSAESPRHIRSGGPLTVPSQPPSDRGIIDAVSGFINDVTLSSSSNIDPKDVIQWARFETADINEPTPEGDSDKDVSPLLLILGYGSGVQVWLIPHTGDAQEVLSWRQGTVRVLRILPTPQHGDCFASKRPLIALCDSASPGPTFCSLSFISIRGGEQVKSIKFKNPILDVLANKRSVVVSFSERFAVFDAATLEDRLAITTCYPCPCPLGGNSPINPLALGDRWLAYAEKKLIPSKRSSGGCEGEGATSYTATVLHAAKSLSKGLRGLGESVAHSLAGGRSTSQSPSPPHADVQQPGVVTVLDIEGNEEEDGQENEEPCDPIVAHFVAHSEAIIALKFDPSGMLLVTADRRGHDFHVFRINPHPFGPTLASVHHLYILHRGDTTAKVQDIAISADSRWAAISTLRGTTHVFAISPYGGACGVRTHTQPRVVNRLSRFQRSAGLPIHATAPAHSPPRVVNRLSRFQRSAGLPIHATAPAHSPPRVVNRLSRFQRSAGLPIHATAPAHSPPRVVNRLSRFQRSAGLPIHATAPAHSPPRVVNRLSRFQRSAGLPIHATAPAHSPPRVVNRLSRFQRSAGLPIHATAPAHSPPRVVNRLSRFQRSAGLPIHATAPAHSPPRVVNRLSRFQRSAGIPIHAAAPAHSPVCEAGWATPTGGQGAWYPNPRLPPFPAPSVTQPLAQLRPTTNLPTHTITRNSSGRQRLSSLSEESNNSAPLLARACFGAGGAGGAGGVGGGASRGAPVPLYLMAASGSLLHLVLHPRPARSVPKEKICDESPVELEVEPVAQWPLQRPPAAADLLAPLPPSNPLLQPLSCRQCADMCMSEEERWLSQVEIVTHAGPHRRLWMGPQFVFKTYNCTGSSSSLSEAETVEVEAGAGRGVARSTPVNMPGARSAVPVLVDSGSASSLEHSPSDSFRRKSLLAESGKATSVCDVQLREDLAEAMKEEHGWPREESLERVGRSPGIVRAVDPLGTVVVPPAEAPPAPVDADAYTTSNADEATFRPVVRAPASLPLQPELVLRPLPRTTTIPVQTVPPLPHLSPEDALPLNLDVIIPAALNVENWLSNNFSHSETSVTVDMTKYKAENYVDVDISAGEVPQKVDSVNLAKNKLNMDLDSDLIECKRDERVSSSTNVELDCEGKEKSLPKSNGLSDDIQSTARVRSKKSPTKSSVSEKAASDISFKDNKSIDDKKILTEEPKKEKGNKDIRSTKDSDITQENKQTKQCKDLKPDKNEKGTKEMNDQISVKTLRENEKDLRDSLGEIADVSKPHGAEQTKHNKNSIKTLTSDVIKTYKQAPTIDVENEPSVAMKKQLSSKKDFANPKSEECISDVITNEDQAWDMLLNESKFSEEKSALLVEEIEETKVKTRRSRKSRREQEDSHLKEEDDSFVEIHNIEGHQTDADELVSISTSSKEYEPSSLNVSKIKKSRTRKTSNKEKNDYEPNFNETILESEETNRSKCSQKTEIEIPVLDTLSDYSSVLKEKGIKEFVSKEKTNKHAYECNLLEDANLSTNGTIAQKSSKQKSQSPNIVSHKLGEKSGSECPQVYVINTIDDDFPDIQITRGNKTRKKSPQPTIGVKSQEQTIIETPIKSWSTIAASKSIKKIGETETNISTNEKTIDKSDESKYESSSNEENQKPSKVSLQDKLIELCKRTDIIVAECGAPSELNFVEEHHSVLHELPPLEGLEFGLDEFKLDVMKDSLLEVADVKVTSPLSKINIDDILSSIKETNYKEPESSMFHLVDIEHAPAKKEKGFSVIKTDKITSQEIQINDEAKIVIESEIMEKSSDDDVASPVLSTDSDKEEKKVTGVSALTQPSSKQSKSKKSRRKKK